MNNKQDKEWERFEATNPRATLLEGYLYFREEDVKNFILSQEQEVRRECESEETIRRMIVALTEQRNNDFKKYGDYTYPPITRENALQALTQEK